MKETKVSFSSRYNEKLVGIETKPSIKKDKYPAIILVHGFGVTKENYGLFSDLSKHLSKAGFLVYRFDFSGCGESEGSYENNSITKMKKELLDILKFVKSQKTVDKNKLGLLAQSLGTSVAIAAKPKVNALIFTGSLCHPKEILSKIFDEYNPKSISTRIKPDGRIVKVGTQFWSEFDKHDLLKCIKKIDCPILFIHGGNDQVVPISEMKSLYKSANKPKDSMIIKGATHGLQPKRDVVYKIVVNWSLKKLSKI